MIKRQLHAWTQSALFPTLLGVVLAIGNVAATTGDIAWRSARLYVSALVYALIFMIVFRLMFLKLPATSAETDDISSMETIEESLVPVPIWRFEYSEKTLPVLRDAARIFCCWLPYLILLCPGIMHWDTGDQIAQFLGVSVFGQPAGSIWDHHPFLDTYVYGGFVQVGKAVFDSYDAGLFLYAVVQYLLFCGSIAWGLAYLRTRAASAKMLRAITCLFCFFPVFPIMAASMVKDITHMVVFLPWCIMYWKLIDSRLLLFRNPMFTIPFITDTVLSALTKKTALYIMTICLLLLVVGKFKSRFKVIGATLAAITVLFVSFFLPNVAYPKLHIIKGGSQAAIAVPIQMLARAAHDYPQDFDAQDKNAINSYLISTFDQISQQYNPYSTDPVTGFTVKDESKKKAFLVTWVKIGMKHPLTYVKAFLLVESGWISFNMTTEIKQPDEASGIIPNQIAVLTTSSVNPNTFGKLSPTGNPSRGQSLVQGIYDAVRAVPVLNVLFSTCLWTAIVPAFVMYCLWRRRRTVEWQDCLQYAPYLIAGGTMFLYPVSLMLTPNAGRYMFHMALLAPFMLGLIAAQPLGKMSMETK